MTREEMLRRQAMENARNLGFGVDGLPPAMAGKADRLSRDVPSQVVPGEGSGIMDIVRGAGRVLLPMAGFVPPFVEAGVKRHLQGPDASAAPEEVASPEQAQPINPALLAPPAPGAPAFVPTTPPAPPKTPDELYMEEVQRKRQMLDGLFPQRQEATTEQQAVDDYAKADMDRTALLARLAFASGLAKAGGGAWADIGQGLAAAGQVMDQGYERYHQALQSAADRAQKRLDTQYADEASRSSAAVELAAAERTAKVDATEKERKRWLDYFGEIKPSDEALISDPEAYDNWRKRYEEFMFTGSTSPYGVTDVRD